MAKPVIRHNTLWCNFFCRHYIDRRYSKYCLQTFVKKPHSLRLKSKLKTKDQDLSSLLSVSGIKAHNTHPTRSPCKCKWAKCNLALIVPTTFSLAPRQTHQGLEKDDFKHTIFSFWIIQAQWRLSSSLLMRLAGDVVIFCLWILHLASPSVGWSDVVLTETLHNLLSKDFPLCRICLSLCKIDNILYKWIK